MRQTAGRQGFAQCGEIPHRGVGFFYGPVAPAHLSLPGRIGYKAGRVLSVPPPHDSLDRTLPIMRYAPLLGLLLLLGGCLEGSTGLTSTREARIRLHVTQGLAGVDHTVLVDGPGRVVLGVACVAGCDFEEGEILQTLTRDQSVYLAQLFRDSGIHDVAGTDFGSQCCDQFFFDLTYEDGDGTSTVRGSAELFPEDLRDAVSQIQALAQGVIPVVVDPDAREQDWPGDWLAEAQVEMAGDRVNMSVRYSGGCAVHDFRLVAWGGWMESYPVQVRAFLSHDDKDDPCDAIVERELSFDLRPLRRAYQDSYGVADPGSTTLVIVLANPNPLSSLSHLDLEYVF